MNIFKTEKALSLHLNTQRKNGLSIGFVPTMGALHNGHLSLISAALQQHQEVVCSIFVNPTQFNNATDFEKYPITLEKDLNLLEETGCTTVFLPSVLEMYPPGYKAPHYDLGYVETILEGKFRVGHFQGVCQVVDRFLEIVKPDMLYLGKKDFQQCKVLEKMVELRNHKVDLYFMPTLREESGLAMSSRNQRLSVEQKALSARLYEELNSIKENIQLIPTKELISRAIDNLSELGFKVDYIEIVNETNMLPIEQWDGEPAVILVAAYIGEIRLIDNISVL